MSIVRYIIYFNYIRKHIGIPVSIDETLRAAWYPYWAVLFYYFANCVTIDMQFVAK